MRARHKKHRLLPEGNNAVLWWLMLRSGWRYPHSIVAGGLVVRLK